MKKPLHIIKTWFETGDVPTQEQFYDAWDSFHHKDDGEVLTDKTVNESGDVTFTFSDGEQITIEKFIPDTSKPMEYIDGLVAQLNTFTNDITALQNNKVDKISGKGLSDTNFTQAEKDKLAGLENYNPPVSEPISFIQGLQDLLTQIQQDISLKVDKVDGKGLSSNDYTDEEKNNVTQNTGKRVLDSERVIWNNKIALWEADKTYTDEMGQIVVIGADSHLYRLIAPRPFTTTDLSTESITIPANGGNPEIPKKWEILGASFPLFELTSISRTQLSPDTTTDLFIRGFLITGNETITIGAGIVTINNVSFRKIDKEPVMVVNITTPSTLHNNLEIVINNGMPITLNETFTVSNGLEYIPSPTSPDAPFVVNQGDVNDLILGEGSIRNLNGVSGQKVIKVDLDIPTDRDFLIEWDVTLNNNGETHEGDCGLANKIAPATGRGSIRYAFYHQGNILYMYNYGTKIGEVHGNSVAGGSFTLKGILNTSNLYDVEYFENGTKRTTLSNQQPDEVLNMFFTTNSLTTFENIKITII